MAYDPTLLSADAAAQVFVQQDDPETTNPAYTGPAVWYILNNAGDVIGKKVRP